MRLALLFIAVTVSGADNVSFSHRRHAPMKLDCVYCHATAKTGERASYPEAGACMTCHRQIATDKPGIRKLAALGKTETIEPERSVYMLADFAFFSHARHRAAKLPCERCHGDVWKMEAVEQVLPMTMKACLGCHRAAHAPTGCTKCHELGQ